MADTESISPEQASAQAEGKHHSYVTHHIPWYVHLLWVLFWILAVTYILSYLFPSLRQELDLPR